MALDVQRGALYWVDPRIALLLCAIEEGLTEAEIITRLQEDLAVPRSEARTQFNEMLAKLDRLRRGSEAAGLPRPTPRRVDVAAIVESMTPPTHRCHVALLGKTVEVYLPTRLLLQDFLSVMGHLPTEDREGSDAVVRVVRTATGYAVLDGETVVAECASRRGVASDVKAAVCHAAVNAQHYDACLHGAVVEVGTGAVLVPAASGHGKTCLALALAAAGHTCLADDLTLVDFNKRGLAVRGVPAASCVKREAWDLLGALHPELEHATIHERADGKIVKYLPVAEPRLEPVPVRAFVVPGFVQGASAKTTTLPPEIAMQHILQSVLAWRAKLTPGSVETLIEGLERIPAFACTYGSPADAVALFEEIVECL